MGRSQGKEITGSELDVIIEALGVTREGLATICGVRPSAPGWWRHIERVPPDRLLRIARELESQLQAREPRKVDLKAREILEKVFGSTLSIIAAMGSANPKAASAFSELFGSKKSQRSATKTRTVAQTVDVLAKFTEAELIAALEKRGIEVFTRKVSKK